MLGKTRMNHPDPLARGRMKPTTCSGPMSVISLSKAKLMLDVGKMSAVEAATVTGMAKYSGLQGCSAACEGGQIKSG